MGDSRAEALKIIIYYNPKSRALDPQTAEPSERFLSELYASMKSALERVSPYALPFLRPEVSTQAEQYPQ